MPGCSNTHQAIELYLKAILKLNHEQMHGHDLIKLLDKYKIRDVYFTHLLQDERLSSFLKELSAAYLIFRYGEAGAASNSDEMIECLDEIAWHLRSIYLRNIKSPSQKIYITENAKSDFLKNNKFFKEKDVTSNPLAQFGLPL